MLASVVVFVFNDALIKLASETMSPVQAIGLRGIFATLWCVLAVALSGAWRDVHRVAQPAVALRGLLEAAAAISFLVALAYIPFGIASAINLSTPLFLALLAVLVLGERVGWRRWSAIAVGFAGVLLVIQPDPRDIDGWTWLVLASSLIGAARDILGRNVPAIVPTTVVSLSSAITVGLIGCVWTTLDGWQPVTALSIAYVIGSSLLLAAGYQLIMLSLRSGAEISLIGAFRYSSVLWALLIGYVLWGEVPNRLAFAGIAVVIASGLYILHRQRVTQPS